MPMSSYEYRVFQEDAIEVRRILDALHMQGFSLIHNTGMPEKRVRSVVYDVFHAAHDQLPHPQAFSEALALFFGAHTAARWPEYADAFDWALDMVCEHPGVSPLDENGMREFDR